MQSKKRVVQQTVVTTEDETNPWARMVAETITGLLKRDQRVHKVMLSLTDEEWELLAAAKKKVKLPSATIARACMLFGLSAFVEAKCKKEVVKRRVDK